MKLNNIKYLFYTNIDNKVLYLRTKLNKYFLSADNLKKIYGLSVRQIDYENATDLEIWCNTINNSYEDCSFTVLKAKDYLLNHLFLSENQTFIFVNGGGEIVASISLGIYKNNPKWSGLFRIAVRKDFQGMHYGYAIVLFALSYLQSMGVKYCEDIVSSKRIPSLNMHLNIGFEPLLNVKNAIYTANQKNVNFIQSVRLFYRLKNAHKKYLRNLENLSIE